jgi:hypothetical protein
MWAIWRFVEPRSLRRQRRVVRWVEGKVRIRKRRVGLVER